VLSFVMISFVMIKNINKFFNFFIAKNLLCIFMCTGKYA